MFAKWYEINGVKCQGLTEAKMAMQLSAHQFNFYRGHAIQTPFGKYTPDFECSDYFIEVKSTHSWFKALGQVSMLENARTEAMGKMDNNSQLKMEWVNENIKPVYVWVSIDDASKDKYLKNIIEAKHKLNRFIGTAPNFIVWLNDLISENAIPWGFPECGNCESTPCRCERDDSWF